MLYAMFNTKYNSTMRATIPASDTLAATVVCNISCNVAKCVRALGGKGGGGSFVSGNLTLSVGFTSY